MEADIPRARIICGSYYQASTVEAVSNSPKKILEGCKAWKCRPSVIQNLHYPKTYKGTMLDGTDGKCFEIILSVLLQMASAKSFGHKYVL